MKKNSWRIFLILWGTYTLVTATKCKDEEPMPVNKDFTKLLLIHAAPDISSLDLVVGGTKKNADSIKYGIGTTYFDAEVVAGKKVTYAINLSKTGAKVFADTQQFEKNINYSLYVINDSVAKNPAALLLSVDQLSAPSPGKAKVRVINLIPDGSKNGFAPTLDVQFVPAGTGSTNAADFKGIKFKNVNQNFIELEKGTKDMYIRQGATINIIKRINNIVLSEGKIYTVIIRGYAFQSGEKSIDVSTVINK
jgi:hypothetical protein